MKIAVFVSCLFSLSAIKASAYPFEGRAGEFNGYSCASSGAVLHHGAPVSATGVLSRGRTFSGGGQIYDLNGFKVWVAPATFSARNGIIVASLCNDRTGEGCDPGTGVGPVLMECTP